MSVGRTLYISDLDGTLLNKNAELSQYTKDTLNQMIADGLCFSVATARTAATALKILDGIHWTVPLIFLNGVLIYDTERSRYAQILAMDAETVALVLSVLKRLNVTGLMYGFSNNVQTTYYESIDNKPLRDFIEERKTRYNKEFIHINSFFDVPPDDIIYFTLLDTYDNIKPVRDALSTIPGISPAFYKDNYSSDLWFLEVFDSKASKQNAVIWLRETYGFERVIGFGDNLNDLPMFAACDTSVAVDNANPEVRAAADHICGANDADGVAKWLAGKVIL